jgi:hypothetical protein
MSDSRVSNSQNSFRAAAFRLDVSAYFIKGFDTGIGVVWLVASGENTTKSTVLSTCRGGLPKLRQNSRQFPQWI